MTPKIRKMLGEMGEATADELAERLQIQTFAGLKQLRDALGDMTRRGAVLKEEGQPVFRLAPVIKGRGDKQQAIWRAVQVEALGFTVRKIEVLAGTCHDYTRRYLRWLEKTGYLVKTGVIKSEDGRRRDLAYKVMPGKERQQPPHWARKKEEGRKGREKGKGKERQGKGKREKGKGNEGGGDG